MGVIAGAAKGRICRVPLGSPRGPNARAEKNQRTIKVAGAPGGGENLASLAPFHALCLTMVRIDD